LVVAFIYRDVIVSISTRDYGTKNKKEAMGKQI
jgi:hypothetical protein